MNWTKGLTALAVVLLGAILAASAATSRSSGISKAEGLTDEGCICHGPNRNDDGVPNEAVSVLFNISGNPYYYKPGQVYNLTVGVNSTDVPAKSGSNQGGFNLRVTVGELKAAEGEDTFIHVVSPTEATHTAEGDQRGRVFNLTWTAPSSESEAAIFTLFVNSVNGDGANDDKDHWNGLTYVVLNKGGTVGGAAGEVDPEEIGVKWLAHWVGIVSFLAVVGILLIYYFVLKYGESIHTTDHRDRKEK